MPDASLLHDLAGQVSLGRVLARPADLAAYSYDSFGASGDRHLPDAVVFPQSPAEVAGVVQVCAHHRMPIIPRGAGSGYAGGAVSDGGVIVAMSRLDGVIGVDVGNARLRVRAGATTAAVHRSAHAKGLYYPPDPGAATTGTIGGNIACNAAGPHAYRYGATADFVVGAEVVLGDGRIVRVGEGHGGEDLLGLILASEGTLGIVTEATLRLLPAPAGRATLAATFSNMEQAVAAVAAITRAGVVPAALECMDRAALDAVAPITSRPVDSTAGALLLIEIEGSEDRVNGEAEATRAALAQAKPMSVEHARNAGEAARLWGMRKAISAAVAAVMVGKVNEDVVVPRDRVAELVNRSRELAVRHELPIVTFGHIGDGNMHLTFLCDPRIPGDRARADSAAADVFDVVLGMGGALTGEHGVGTTKLPFVERQLGAGGLALMHRIKQIVDPVGLLNPGKKLPQPSAVAAEAATPVAV